jgi:hypothetical protein
VLFDLRNRAHEFFGGRRLPGRGSDSRRGTRGNRMRGIQGNSMLGVQMAGNSTCLAHRPQSVRSGSQRIYFSELQPRQMPPHRRTPVVNTVIGYACLVAVLSEGCDASHWLFGCCLGVHRHIAPRLRAPMVGSLSGSATSRFLEVVIARAAMLRIVGWLKPDGTLKRSAMRPE